MFTLEIKYWKNMKKPFIILLFLIDKQVFGKCIKIVDKCFIYIILLLFQVLPLRDIHAEELEDNLDVMQQVFFIQKCFNFNIINKEFVYKAFCAQYNIFVGAVTQSAPE